MVFTEKIAYLYYNLSVYLETFFYSIQSTVHPFTSFLYCNCCLGTTGYMFSCCYGMCLIQSDSQAVSACLSRAVRNPAGLCLMVCLFLQGTGLFSGRMQPSSLQRVKKYFCCLSAHTVVTIIYSICGDLIGLH